MDLAAAIAVIASAIAPFITALFVNPKFTPTQKRVIAGIVALVLGVIVAIATGQITGYPDNPGQWAAWILVNVGVVISLAQGFYRQWKGAATSLEERTSPPQDENAI